MNSSRSNLPCLLRYATLGRRAGEHAHRRERAPKGRASRVPDPSRPVATADTRREAPGVPNLARVSFANPVASVGTSELASTTAMAHFDPYWNKDNKRVSGMFQEASRRKEEEAAAAARKPPQSTLLDGLHETNAARRWQGGALQRLNASLNAQPRAPAPARAPAPTNDRRKSFDPAPAPGTNTLSRGYQPKAPGELCSQEEIQRKKEAALKRRLERERTEKEELQRKLDQALQQQQRQPQQQQQQQQQQPPLAANLQPNPPVAPKRNSMVSFAAAKPAAAPARSVAQHPTSDDKLWPDQPFEIDVVLADDPVDDKLTVRAKSFPGYPAHAVLMDGGLRARNMWKTLSEKGACATWDVKPTAVYRPLLARARAETLLRVEDRVSGKVEACRAEVKAADERVSRAIQAAEASSLSLPSNLRDLVDEARGVANEAGGGGGGRGGRGRGRGGRGRGGRGRGRGNAEPEPKPRFQSFSAAAEEEKVGGLGESDVVAAIVFGLRSVPGPKVVPAAADARALVRVLRHAQSQIGVPLGVSAATDPTAPILLAPVVARAVAKVGFGASLTTTTASGAEEDGARRTGKEDEKGKGRESIASWFNRSEPEPAETAPEKAPEVESSMDTAYDHDGDRVAPEVIELLSDDDDDDRSAQSARTTTRHPPGTLVTALGLRSRPELNGDVFEVRAWCGERQRYHLARWGTGTPEVYARPENVTPMHAGPSEPASAPTAREEEPITIDDDDDDGGPSCRQMSDDDLRGLVRDQLRAATEENRLESTTVRQIMDALEETYLVSLSGERKRFVREVVDEFIAERTRSARKVSDEAKAKASDEERGRREREALVEEVRAGATELIRAKKDLRRIEDAIKPKETRKRRELAAGTRDAGDYIRFAPNARTGAGMAWEGAGGMSMGPNVEDFF